MSYEEMFKHAEAEVERAIEEADYWIIRELFAEIRDFNNKQEEAGEKELYGYEDGGETIMIEDETWNVKGIFD